MDWSIIFFVNSFILGVGLAMDAFSVSCANGLSEPDMKYGKMTLIAGVFAVFQALMPMIGWVCVHTVVTVFKSFEMFIPWIALILLLYVGGKMLIEGIKWKGSEPIKTKLVFSVLIIQGIATSIDALSVGFAIAEYDIVHTLVCAVVIAAVTFVICMAGLIIGKRFAEKLSGYATILGGIILILIGIEVFVTGEF